HANLTVLFIALILALPTTVAAQPVDDIVAVVGDDVILASELTDAVNQARLQLGARADTIPVNTLRSNVLDQLILNRLQVNRAKQLGLTVTKEEIDQGMARLAQQNKMRPNAFLHALNQRGVSVKSVRTRVRRHLLISKVRK